MAAFPNNAEIRALIKKINRLPFILSAPSMVFGENLVENVKCLSQFLPHVEIVLFQTPTLSNIPSMIDLHEIREIGEDRGTTFSVHLPASIEVASENKKRREESVRSVIHIVALMSTCQPKSYILHIPLTTPTLTFTPGSYVYRADQNNFGQWTPHAMESLCAIQQETGIGTRLLVENINYSPRFLEPFLQNHHCRLCLDLGHLMLGGETVLELMKAYIPVTKEIHLHGVTGNDEHQDLSVIQPYRVKKWLTYLDTVRYDGIVNVEVFTHRELEISIDILGDALGQGRVP